MVEPAATTLCNQRCCQGHRCSFGTVHHLHINTCLGPALSALLAMLLLSTVAAVPPPEWRLGTDRFHVSDSGPPAVRVARDVDAGRTAAQQMLERLSLFKHALEESSAGRAATDRAAVWARSTMCVPATTARVLMYNRVPKTGSTALKTAVNLLRRPGVRMFSLTNEQASMRGSLEYRQSRVQAVCDLITDGVPLVFISGHVNFVKLSESPQCRPPPEVANVNIIRDPVARLVSSYHYHYSATHVAQLKELQSAAVETGGAASERALDADAFRTNEQQRKQLRDAEMLLRDAVSTNLTLDQCALRVRKRAERDHVSFLQAASTSPCAKPLLTLQWPYFCGFDDDCRMGAVLEGNTLGHVRALRNVKANYLLVGLTEQFNATMAAFEMLAPQFFLGLPAAVHSLSSDRASSNVGTASSSSGGGSGGPSEETLEFLRALAEETGDMEFYLQSKKHFHRKLACLVQRMNEGV
jgi:hypothetical protein